MTDLYASGVGQSARSALAPQPLATPLHERTVTRSARPPAPSLMPSLQETSARTVPRIRCYDRQPGANPGLPASTVPTEHRQTAWPAKTGVKHQVTHDCQASRETGQATGRRTACEGLCREDFLYWLKAPSARAPALRAGSRWGPPRFGLPLRSGLRAPPPLPVPPNRGIERWTPRSDRDAQQVHRAGLPERAARPAADTRTDCRHDLRLRHRRHDEGGPRRDEHVAEPHGGPLPTSGATTDDDPRS